MRHEARVARGDELGAMNDACTVHATARGAAGDAGSDDDHLMMALYWHDLVSPRTLVGTCPWLTIASAAHGATPLIVPPEGMLSDMRQRPPYASPRGTGWGH